MSIAMALLARLAARGNSNCAMLERDYRGKWANLALYAPDLVAIDLVLAEALVAAADRQAGGILMTDRFDPLETSALITSGYRRYLRSLLPVRDPRIATALDHEITHSHAAHQGAAA